ncbi:LEA14-like dessication related protein [Geothermobacter ehrlichii]|uniref:LEA14-like dessication related protein n=1 Tax=Geothermobacter ehrlichii TaxID=213224 RepID=A0A5D3WP10_9BACT|nr:LEA type 2 family protein [Geothermobacter ehrlichii]TYP00288.1 LEA14-like dessication related protein [Geothermobacter ehrlichii]
MTFLPRCHLLPVVFVLLLAGGCAALHPKPPQVSLAALQLTDANLSHARLTARLELHNPNPYALDIRGADYRLALNGVEVSRGRTDNPVRIEANGRGYLDIDLVASYLDLLKLLRGLKRADTVDYLLEGTLDLSGPGIVHLPVPIRRQGSISLGDLLP